MVSKEEKNKGGRPKKMFQKEIFEELCHIQCTKAEICSVLKIDNNTLDRMINDEYGDSFSNIYKKETENGKTSLRRMQFKLAESNATMAIWLGKQYLDQKDKQEIDTTISNKIEIINDLPRDVDED